MLLSTFRRRLRRRLPSLLVTLSITLAVCAALIATQFNHPDVARATSSFSAIDWGPARSSPIPRSEAVSAVVNGKLYVFGGYIDRSFNPTRRSDVYNPATNRWKRIADLPKPPQTDLSGGLTHVGAASDGEDIYLTGGYAGKSGGGQVFAVRNVWKYNIDKNTWAAMPSLPQARGSGALTHLDGKLHFFGGADINRADKGDHWVLKLDGATSWKRAAALPNPRSHLADVPLGGKIYAIGGQHDVDEDLVTQTDVHVWSPETSTWRKVESLPEGRSHIGGATFVMDGRIIIVGGEVAHTRPVRSVMAYNPVSNAWKALTPLPTARHSGVGGSIKNQIFYTTGSSGFQTKTYRGVPVPP